MRVIGEFEHSWLFEVGYGAWIVTRMFAEHPARWLRPIL
jgi:hypothetical protein